MTVACDPIMDEVYAIRHDLSESCGHDASAYFNLVREEKERAKDLGMSYLDYCLLQLDDHSSKRSAPLCPQAQPFP